MARGTLQQRVAKIEKTVEKLLASENATRAKDWQRSLGMFTGDELMRQIFEKGRKVRQADRRRTHRRSKKSRRTTS
jgi:hypothetical protein